MFHNLPLNRFKCEPATASNYNYSTANPLVGKVFTSIGPYDAYFYPAFLSSLGGKIFEL